MPLLLTAAAILLGVGWLGLLLMLARKGKPAEETADGFTLRHSPLLRLFSIAALFGGEALVGFWVTLAPPKNMELAWGLAFAALVIAALGFALMWEAYRWRLTVNNAGLDCRSPWKPPRKAAWSEVMRVTYSSMNGWYIVQFHHGSFCVPAIVPGVTRFLAECQKRIPDPNQFG
jgi:hypothetical protein